MRSDPVKILQAGDLSQSTLDSNGIYLDQLYAYSMHCVWSGTDAAGTISLQGSNDNVIVASGTNASANVVNWTTLTSPGTQAVSGTGSCIFDVPYTGIRWVRAHYDKSGTSAGSITITFNGKG